MWLRNLREGLLPLAPPLFYTSVIIDTFFLWQHAAPQVTCGALVSLNGGIFVRWSIVYDGGLPLHRVTIVVATTDGTIREFHVSISSHTFFIPLLTAGFIYSVSIVAANPREAAVASCPPFLHSIGESLCLYICRCNEVIKHSLC